MKIVFIIDSLQRHGTQRFLTHLVRGLQDLGYTQKLIALNNASEPNIENDLSSTGCAVTRIGKFSLVLGGAGWWRMVSILKRFKPDVVMTLLDFSDTLGRPAARLAGCGVIVTSIRARNPTKSLWQRWLGQKSMRWADRVVFNSAHIVDYGLRQEGVREEQVMIIPNGVEDLKARSHALRDEYRKRLDVSPDTMILGSMGRLHPQKNLSLLLRAVSKLSTQRSWKVVLLGDGPERSKLVSLARELGLMDRLIWLGARTDVEGWLAAMDVFIHTADFEGMPNAVMEAMAMGLPVVASAVDGVRELTRDGSSGFLVAPGNADEFAKRIAEVIGNPELARRVGEEARRTVLERFDMPGMIDAYHQLFISLANRRTA